LGVLDKALTVYEAYLRSEKGKKIPENVWDSKIIPDAALQMKEKYDINFTNEFIPTDKDLKKRLFLAGMEMLVSTGVYNVDTEKVIKVTEEEVLSGLRSAPDRVQLGEFRDAVFLQSRKGNAAKKPIIQGGPTGATVSEEIFVPMIQSYAQEPIIDTIVNGVMATVDGIPATTNTPFEIKATMAELRAVREACARVGRPYMGI